MTLHTIPASRSFVDDLAAGVMARYGADPLALARVTILLPSRRACRTLRHAFLRQANGTPLLLPAIRPFSEADEDEMALAATDAPDETLPPAIAPLRRRLVLARYLMAAYGNDYTPAQSFAMAGDLARLLDMAATEGVSLDALDTLVPDEYAAHWQISLTFLRDVLRVHWPQQLLAEGATDIGDRRRTLLEKQAAHWQQHPPAGPVIAAGPASATPALATLLKTIAALPHGHVVLPALDTLLDDPAWHAIDDGHPQAGLSDLLLKLDATRADIYPWLDDTLAQPNARDALASAVMRPAATLDVWTKTPLPADAWQNLTLLEADTLDEEAGAIALMMRSYAENTTATHPCVLVTPDRVLANRVALLLQRWNIAVDDSAGVPLAQTPLAQWLLLLAQVLATSLEPVAFLSLLKNAYAAGGVDWPQQAPAYRTFVRMLDRHILRGPRPEEGFTPLLLRATARPDIAAGLAHLQSMFAPALAATDTLARLRALISLAEHLAATPEKSGPARVWNGEAGEAMATVLAALLEHADILPDLDWQGCADVLATAMEGIVVRPLYGTHPRLLILGLIEARLYQSAKMILGGLNEGAWPAPARVDAWLSRPMRKTLGLPAPEHALALSAHDFASALSAADVTLTRSKMRDGAPTIPARWLQRLETLAQAQPVKPDLRAGAHIWLDLARALDAPHGPAAPVARPAPCPDTSLRPLRLSVTEISKLHRDPYGIYARHVLGLKPFDPIAAEPDAAQRGTLIHDVLSAYGTAFPASLPPDALDRLHKIGEGVFADAHQHPDVIGHWWPRFLRMTSALVPYDRAWRRDMLRLWPELAGQMTFPSSCGEFILHGRADRIEHRRDGWAIIDYKTGAAPSGKAVKAGLEPQLPLLGAILLAGGFNTALNIHALPDGIATLSYWKTGGTSDAQGVSTLPDPMELCAGARDGMASLVRAYLDDGIAYTCWPDPDNKLRDDYEYAHLARIDEWSEGGQGEDAA